MNPDEVTFQAPPSSWRTIVKWLLYYGAAMGNVPRYFRHRAWLVQAAARMNVYEGRHLKALSRFVKPGDEVVDIGANFGAYSLVLAKLVGPAGKVHAFEPLPPVLESLRDLSRRFPQVNLHASLLSDEGGSQVPLKIPFISGHIPEPAFASLHLPDAPALSYECTTEKLDDFLPCMRGVTFLKIDVEGHEQKVLAGAEQFLERFKPVIQFESVFSPGEFDSWRAWADRHGYDLMQLAGEDLVPLESRDQAIGYNFYFLPRKEGA